MKLYDVFCIEIHPNFFQFAWTLLILHISFCVIYFLLVSYDASADAKHVDNQLGKNHHLEENLKKYPSMSTTSMKSVKRHIN